MSGYDTSAAIPAYEPPPQASPGLDVVWIAGAAALGFVVSKGFDILVGQLRHSGESQTELLSALTGIRVEITGLRADLVRIESNTASKEAVASLRAEVEGVRAAQIQMTGAFTEHVREVSHRLDAKRADIAELRDKLAALTRAAPADVAPTHEVEMLRAVIRRAMAG